MSKYYSVDTCNHPAIKAEGELLVVLDEKKNPIWHHDQSDFYVDLGESWPRDLTKLVGKGDIFELNEVNAELAARIDAYLSKKGY